MNNKTISEFGFPRILGLNTTSGDQFAALLLVKPDVWFARAVVNWRARSVAKSAHNKDFLSDVLVAVASLDLKVPIGAASQTLLTRVRLRLRRRLVLVPRAFFLFLPASLLHKEASAEERVLGEEHPSKNFLEYPPPGSFVCLD